MSDNPAQEIPSSEFSFKETFLVFWNRKLLIISVTSALSIFTIFYSLSLPNEYRATAILSESLEDRSSLASGASGQSSVSGLASLAGISLDAGSSSEADHKRYILVLFEKFLTSSPHESNLPVLRISRYLWVMCFLNNFS